MTDQSQAKPDHWSSQAYTSAASFVPLLTTKVLSYLSPQPNEHILDIGCGDGQLTAQIAPHLLPHGKILGLDASQSFITSAEATQSTPNTTYIHHDACALSTCDLVTAQKWDKIFSNAAMHWILRPPATTPDHPAIRAEFFRAVYEALKPGGTFVFEQGGKGNVAEVHTAVTGALVRVGGVGIEVARDANPWFFPSVEWMRGALEEAGFEVVICEVEYRPTKLTEENKEGTGGIEGWVRLMCAPFLEVVEVAKREAVVKEVCEVLETVIEREEDGSKWLGYLRLRAVARKAP